VGYYIEVPDKLYKAEQIRDIYKAVEIPAPKTFSTVPEDMAIICVVQNPTFDAAAYCYNESELEQFREFDGRRKTWLVMDKKLAEKLSGYSIIKQ
jgi:hypothetical protein